MQVRKIYQDINPELLYSEVRDFITKQGAVLDKAKLETYSMPGGSAHVVRGTLTFRIPGDSGTGDAPGIRSHIIGSSAGDTKLMLDIDEKLFPGEKVRAIEEDLDFIFGSFEIKES